MPDKQALRERVWDALEDSGEARFPFPPHGRIPNFAGASDAADRLAETEAWRTADAVKANPDAPQLPARRRALRDGKTVYMAVPRLRDEKCFLELDPEAVSDLDAAPTLSHVDEHATQVGPDALPHVDLVLSGSVAVTEAGARVGKGEGYSDLEFAVLSDLGLVDDDTTIATTVHEMQVVDDAEIAPDDHDVPMDLVVTPERTVRTDTEYDRPTGVDWDALSEERIAEMPVLARLRDEL
ncbi:5-formyltetrahydrofolate cyclo-ligase [Halobacterium litoreum]|uniref:5-formyltetrahydrofolate cyclo-ligase n=1 Tax=Halobacterium litoreum TaxID=2039234 RepID=A0ABD5NDN9_9EURY|nr:5-formyltetrahydrofolate cyclo-ligase [Halobacterium litoreum]UHH13842.1 5-formyltetrahydrofolate cyclo-ligase [Halobacterium litoreum]